MTRCAKILLSLVFCSATSIGNLCTHLIFKMRSIFIVALFVWLAHALDTNYFDDGVLFRISTSNRDVLDNRLGAADKPDLIPIVTAEDEQYFCMIPEIQTKVRSTCSIDLTFISEKRSNC